MQNDAGPTVVRYTLHFVVATELTCITEHKAQKHANAWYRTYSQYRSIQCSKLHILLIPRCMDAMSSGWLAVQPQVIFQSLDIDAEEIIHLQPKGRVICMKGFKSFKTL